MTLVPPNPEYQFIQDTEPSNAKKSDWWLDTSVNPPRSKVYDGNGFVRPEEIEFVDARISQSGGTEDDIRFSITPDRVDQTKRQDYVNNFASEGFANSKTAMENIAHSPTVMDEVSASQTAMDAVAGSQTAMDAVDDAYVARNAVTAVEMASAKFLAGRATLDPSLYTTLDNVGSNLPTNDQAAMDALSASQTARESVNASDVAYDRIAAVGMAIGKFVAGSAGLTAGDYAGIGAVAASQTAMDAVAGSQTAMDAALGSLIARTAALSSPHVVPTVWSGNDASQHIWDAGTVSGEGTNTLSWESPTFDVTDLTELEIETEVTNSNDTSVIIGGNTLYSSNSDHDWTTRTFDISGYSGNKTVTLQQSRTFDSLLQSFVPSGTGSGVALKFYDNSPGGSSPSSYGRFRNLRFQ